MWVHPMVTQSLPVVSVPLILFSDDSSGNRSKKWNCFDVWYLLLGGLSKEENAKIKNIHFLTCSNKASPLELATPIVTDLLKMEKGVQMYDGSLGQQVIVVSHVICLLADNPRASDLLSHMGSAARKFCRLCMV